MLKYGLIIQGPLNSPGVNGKNWVEKNLFSRESKWGIQPFNAIDNTNKIIEEYSSYFDCIVLSTWDDEQIEKINPVKNLKIILSSKKESEKYKRNNGTLQLISLSKGLDFINQELGTYSIVFKLRTDFYLPAAEIKKFIQNEWEKQSSEHTISIPFIQKNRMNSLTDCYVLARAKSYKNFCDSCLQFESHFPNTASFHYWGPASYLTCLYNHQSHSNISLLNTKSLQHYNSSSALREDAKDIFAWFRFAIQNKIFIPLPESFFNTARWRDESFNSSPYYSAALKNMIFYETLKNETIDNLLSPFEEDLLYYGGQFYSPNERQKFIYSKAGIRRLLAHNLRSALKNIQRVKK